MPTSPATRLSQATEESHVAPGDMNRGLTHGPRMGKAHPTCQD